jgi:NAD-dependent dihydropyrimidine dehydrogenase PreA subunit
MAGKRALVDYRRCDPDRCEGGVCAAALACTKKLLYQEEPYDPPMTDPSTCKGCADCIRTCPRGAIRVVEG